MWVGAGGWRHTQRTMGRQCSQRAVFVDRVALIPPRYLLLMVVMAAIPVRYMVLMAVMVLMALMVLMVFCWFL